MLRTPLIGWNLFHFRTKPTSLRGVGDYQKAFVMSSLQDNGKNFEFKLAEDLELFPFPFLSPQ